MNNNSINNNKNYPEAEAQIEDIRKKAKKQYACLLVIAFQMFVLIGLFIYFIFFHIIKCNCNCNCGNKNITKTENNQPSKADETSDNDNENNENVDIPIYSSIWNISEDSTVKLSNPESNDIYLEYILSDEKNNVFYVSPKIKAGEDVQAKFTLSKGIHNCTMSIKSYDTEESPANSSVSNTSVTIKFS